MRGRLLVGMGIAAALVALFWFGMGRDPRAIPSPLVGKPAPEFALALFDGRAIRLSQFRGRPVVVNFWASWCKPCIYEAPLLEGTWRRYRGRGFVLVGVNVQDTDPDARAFMERFGFTFLNGPDRTGAVGIDYGVYGLPETFFVRRDGTIAHKHIGQISEEMLIQEIEGLFQREVRG